jgi:hypothetical protein
MTAAATAALIVVRLFTMNLPFWDQYIPALSRGAIHGCGRRMVS